MSDVAHRAREAIELGENPIFCAILQEIEDAATVLFRNAQSDITQISRAHESVRAVQLIRDALTARIDAAKFEEHQKGQHRGSD